MRDPVVVAGLDLPDVARENAAGLYPPVAEHRAVFLALSSDPFADHVQRVLDRLDAVTAEIAARHGYTFDPYIAVRIVFAAVTTMALHQGSLLADRTVNDIVNEAAATLALGLTVT
jgi:hypothetical protein